MRQELLPIRCTPRGLAEPSAIIAGDARWAPPRWPAAMAVASIAMGLMLDAAQLGPFAEHMGAHILLMNAVAPFLALTILGRFPDLGRLFASGRTLAAACLAQLALLWGWHAPPAFEFALGTPAVLAISQASLFMAAGLFWLAIFSDRSAARWHAMLALLVTGKLFCLLGVLLVFAPRLIYPGFNGGHGHATLLTEGALGDQQLAGLLMLVACPLSYLLAGVTIAARWLRTLAGE